MVELNLEQPTTKRTSATVAWYEAKPLLTKLAVQEDMSLHAVTTCIGMSKGCVNAWKAADAVPQYVMWAIKGRMKYLRHKATNEAASTVSPNQSHLTNQDINVILALMLQADVAERNVSLVIKLALMKEGK